jgi:uncharacterized C2H2 Zn-finger protein
MQTSDACVTARDVRTESRSKPDSSRRDTDTLIRCLNCRETFDGLEEYEAHQWREHAGELDRGETWINRSV